MGIHTKTNLKYEKEYKVICYDKEDKIKAVLMALNKENAEIIAKNMQKREDIIKYKIMRISNK